MIYISVLYLVSRPSVTSQLSSTRIHRFTGVPGHRVISSVKGAKPLKQGHFRRAIPPLSLLAAAHLAEAALHYRSALPTTESQARLTAVQPSLSRISSSSNLPNTSQREQQTTTPKSTFSISRFRIIDWVDRTP